MAAAVCPFLKQLAKDPNIARNASALAALCPHLAATGLSPLSVLAGVGAPAALAAQRPLPAEVATCTGALRARAIAFPRACPPPRALYLPFPAGTR